MKRILIIFFLIPLISNMEIYSQEISKDFNFIITVDDNVVVGSIANLRLIVSETNDNNKLIEAAYIPGKLTINKVDIEKLFSDRVNGITLMFDYYEYLNKEQVIYNYKIEIKKSWLQFSFIVLRIYNLDKRKYSKIFYPLEGQNYTYEIDLPSNSILRIRKSNSKNK